MFQKGHNQPFFKSSAPAPRPLSEATEIYDTEFEEDLSDTEENNSPRLSVESVSPHLKPHSIARGLTKVIVRQKE